jgi:hypothetical protein
MNALQQLGKNLLIPMEKALVRSDFAIFTAK